MLQANLHTFSYKLDAVQEIGRTGEWKWKLISKFIQMFGHVDWLTDKSIVSLISSFTLYQ